MLVASAVHDVMLRKAMGDELRLAKAEAVTEEKASFLATISHQIRTPMNDVIGMVDLLGQTLLDPKQRQMVKTIRDSRYSLLTIINDIFDF